MTNDPYSADNVCRAFWMRAFIDAGLLDGASLAARILLMPAFHDELCITLRAKADRTEVTASVLQQRYEPGRLTVPVFEDYCQIDGASSATIFALLRETIACKARKPAIVVIADGMMSEFAVIERSGASSFRTHVSARPEAKVLARALLEAIWPGLSNPLARNAVAAAAQYVDLELPLLDVPEATRHAFVQGVAVLGDTGDKSDLLKVLRSRPRGLTRRSS